MLSLCCPPHELVNLLGYNGKELTCYTILGSDCSENIQNNQTGYIYSTLSVMMCLLQTMSCLPAGYWQLIAVCV